MLTQQGVQESYRLVRQDVTRQRWIPFHKELRIHFPEIQASLEAQEFEILMDAITSVALAPAPRVFQSYLYSLLPVSNSRLAKHYGHPLMPASLVALRALDCEVYRLSEEIRIMSPAGGQGQAQYAAAGMTAAGSAFESGSSAIQRMDKWWMVFATSEEVQDQLLAELDGALNGRLAAMKQVNKLAQEADLLDREQVLDTVSRYLAEKTAPGVLCLTAPPGSGKQFILDHFAAESDSALGAAKVFTVRVQVGSNCVISPRRLLTLMCAQLLRELSLIISLVSLSDPLPSVMLFISSAAPAS